MEALTGDGVGQHSIRIDKQWRICFVWTARITADTALRLARYFGTTDHFWLNLQTRFDLEVEKDHLGDKLEAIRPLQSA